MIGVGSGRCGRVVDLNAGSWVGSGVVVEPGGEFGGVVPVEEGDGEVVEEFGWELFDSVVFWVPCVVEASV